MEAVISQTGAEPLEGSRWRSRGQDAATRNLGPRAFCFKQGKAQCQGCCKTKLRCCGTR